MKSFLFIVIFCLAPLAAHADFSLVPATDMSSSAAQRTGATSSTAVRQPVIIHRQKPRPSLEIVNERYVPEDVKQKYKMGDDYFNMTQAKPQPPVVIEAAPLQAPVPLQNKKRLEIISGPPPVMPEVTPVPLVAVAAPIPEPVPVPVARLETWRARQGELLKDVLKRWSDRTGTDFVWTAAESPKISREFSYIGSFENAVAGLMNQDSGQLKMRFSDDVDVPVSEPVSIVKNDGGDMRMLPETMSSVRSAPQNTWFAANGASLKAVLQAWAETANATLVWQADQDFAVPRSLNEKGKFEEALAVILSGYEKKRIRPVGQLYKNPVSGEKVVVIKTDKAG